MKPSVRHSVGRLAWLPVLLLVPLPVAVRAQGTTFTYQGRLDSDGSPANGIFDLQFAIFDSATGGSLVGGPLTHAATAVSNGLFTVSLDFGGGVFTDAERWLEIAVRTNGGGAFVTLTPRQPITATPYALHSAGAESARSLSGTVSATQLTGTLTASRIGVGTVTADKLAAGVVTRARLDPAIGVWTRSREHVFRLNGNVGIGTNNPAQRLHVASNVAVEQADRFAVNARHIELGSQTTAGGQNALALGSGTDAYGRHSMAAGHRA